MSFTFCTSGAAVIKAGFHRNTAIDATATASGALILWSNEAEGRIEAETHTDWTTTYSSLPTGIKNILAETASSLIAMKIISYDPTGYLTREADMLMNNNDDIVKSGLAVLSDKTKHTLASP